jgi:hypothetical protein
MPETSRGRVSAIRDPAIAVAAAKCWLARWNGGRGARVAGLNMTTFHPEECGFCEYPVDRLMASIEHFVAWSGLDEDVLPGDPMPLRDQVESFLSLPRQEQARLVTKAQGYTT